MEPHLGIVVFLRVLLSFPFPPKRSDFLALALSQHLPDCPQAFPDLSHPFRLREEETPPSAQLELGEEHIPLLVQNVPVDSLFRVGRDKQSS
jgi:hypothetical protein